MDGQKDCDEGGGSSAVAEGGSSVGRAVKKGMVGGRSTTTGWSVCWRGGVSDW